MEEKEAANAASESDELKELYVRLTMKAANGEDCSATLQELIDYSYNAPISAEELQRRLA